MKRKGQGAFEYVLLLGGVLLIVVLAVVLLRGGLFESSSQNVELTACQNSLVTASGCFENGAWVEDGVASVTESCQETLAANGYECGAAADPALPEGQCYCGTSPA